VAKSAASYTQMPPSSRGEAPKKLGGPRCGPPNYLKGYLKLYSTASSTLSLARRAASFTSPIASFAFPLA
jgi:hypothetical protein